MSDNHDGGSGRFGFLRSLQSGMNAMKAGSSNTYYPATLLAQKTLMSGWLKKQGGMVRSWHRRWFTLKEDGYLYYFSSEDESKTPGGTIQLSGNRIVELAHTNEPEKFLFEIVPGGRDAGEVYQLWATADDDRKAWVKALRRVMFSQRGGAIFGQSIEETMMYDHGRRKVPTFIEKCVSFLVENGIETEGIFRLPGRSSLIRELKEAFDSCEIPDLDPTMVDVHTVASLLKLYLRELPSPLVPYDKYEAVIKIVTRDLPLNPEESLIALEECLKTFPQVEYNMLQYLCGFLAQIARNEEVNKMSAMNLATCFVQSFIRPEEDDPALLMGTSSGRTQVTFIMINENEKLFRHEYTPQGGAITVDRLLDVDALQQGEKHFDATSHGHKPALKPLDRDLLELDLNRQSVASLPEPMLPKTDPGTLQNVDIDAAYSKGLSRKGSKRTAVIIDKEDSDMDSMRSNSDNSQLATPVDDYFAYTPTSTFEFNGESEAIMSKRLTEVTSCKNNHRVPPVPPTRPEMRTKSTPSVPPRPQSLQTPKVPPRPDKKHASTINFANSASNRSAEEPGKNKPARLRPYDENGTEMLLHVDTQHLSKEELHDHVVSAHEELSKQMAHVRELEQAMVDLERSHQKKLVDLVKKLNDEKESTQECVEKIVELQDKLREYEMVYGPIQQ